MATPTILPVQQPTQENFLRIVGRLYRASIEGDWEAAKVDLKGSDDLVRYITENKETSLHVAAAVGHSTKFVRNLVDTMSDDDLKLRNGDGNTAFCLAAISGNVGMAKIMVEKNSALPNICGSENKMPLYLAAFHGNRDMVTFLYNQSKKMSGESWTDDNKDAVLLKCIQAGIFDVALRILKENTKLPQDKHAWDMLQVLARNPDAFDHVGSWPIISQITSFLAFIGLVTRPVLKENNATQLLGLLWERDMVPPPCREVKNAASQTPQELFMENHKDLVYQGVNWINGTINQSMVVAALVCTIGFSVVYSIPGGFHQENGFPIFLRDRHFIAFIVMDAISFILSTSSILIFLSIILSRHQRNTELLLKKWVVGQLALLTSILAIVVAFAYRTLLRVRFKEMLGWFLQEYLLIPEERPIPPTIDDNKEVELLDLYLVVQRKVGQRSVSARDLGAVIAKDLEFDYDKAYMMRVIYAKYLVILENSHRLYKAEEKEKKNKTQKEVVV
ncbi:hypothetical protein L1987_00053 [Smallanthus sonchifolius]|uniref:Uncharacterized protein n=1 Tax=Smallanthus sonchifolius TaxID=185202 RepID=A0ACB9K199_9ASTR|nr:hypothetical protein L1987_00053 [Smallanthus sonchifolius]